MLKCGLIISTSFHCTELVQTIKTCKELSTSIQNISCDTFYDPDGTQPTGYVGQVSLNSIQQNRRSCLGLSNLARSHIHHLHIIMHDTSQPHSFSALSTIFFRILPASHSQAFTVVDRRKYAKKSLIRYHVDRGFPIPCSK